MLHPNIIMDYVEENFPRFKNMLLLCRDGILRYNKWYYDRKAKKGHYYSLPLTEYEKHIPHVFYSSLGDEVELEEGITLRELMLNFKPWQDLVGNLASMDFPAFIREVEKTPKKIMDMNGNNADPEHRNYSHIEISGYIELKEVPRFKRPSKEEQEKARKRNIWLSGKPMITDQYYMEERWDYSGVLMKPEFDEGANCEIKEYSLHYTPLSEIANLPVQFKDTISIYESTANSNYLTYQGSLFNPENPVLRKVEGSNPKYYSLILDMTAHPTIFKTFIRGVFWEMGFHFSPITRDEKFEDLKSSIEDLKEILDDAEKEVDGIEMIFEDTVDESIPESIQELLGVCDEENDNLEEDDDKHLIDEIMNACGDLVRIIEPNSDED